MDINNDFINTIKQKSPDYQIKNSIQKILLEYNIKISFDNIKISQKSFSCSGLTLYQKISLKRNKRKILNEIQKQNPYIYDIL